MTFNIMQETMLQPNMPTIARSGPPLFLPPPVLLVSFSLSVYLSIYLSISLMLFLHTAIYLSDALSAYMPLYL